MAASRKSVKGASALVTTILVLVILAAANLLGGRLFLRTDLTERREYTISSATRNVVRGIDDVVNIKVYFSKDLPSYLASLDRQVKDLLDEYRARSHDKLLVEFIDPTGDPIAERAVTSLGIPKLQLNVIESDRAEVRPAFMGIAVQYADKTETIPVIQSVANLEYDLTAAIVKVTTPEKTVGFAGSGEASLNQGLQGLQQVLSKQYVIRPVSLSSGPVPDDVNTLIVVDHDDLDDASLYYLDQFVMRGGRMLALVPGVDVPLNTLQGRDREVKMGPMLRTYGVEVENSLMADGQAATATFSQGYMQYSLPYVWWPQISGNGFEKENPITATLDAVVLPWPSPLNAIPPDTSGGGSVTVEPLVKSSERSFAARAPYDLNPQSRPKLPAEGVGARTLALALKGRFQSHWAGATTIPGDTTGAAANPIPLSPETQMVVVGDWRFITDQFLGQFPGNSVLLANAVDWMTLGNDLIAIRSRSAGNRPLKEIDDGKRGLLKILCVLGLPVLVIVGGLARMRMSTNRRVRLAYEYGGKS